MFRGLFRMQPACQACGLKYEREPGYFLGSIYVNYGLTALLTTLFYSLFRFAWQWPSRPVIWALAGFCLVFPALFFRHARALWLAMDCRFDRALFAGTGATHNPDSRHGRIARPE